MRGTLSAIASEKIIEKYLAPFPKPALMLSMKTNRISAAGIQNSTRRSVTHGTKVVRGITLYFAGYRDGRATYVTIPA